MPARGVNMSPKLLYVIAALVLIGAIVPAQADQGIVGSFTLPGTLNYTYAEISAVCAPYGGVLNGEAGSTARFTNYNAAWEYQGGGVNVHETYTYTSPAELTGTYYVRMEAYCVNSNFHPIKTYIYGPSPFVVANFTGTPLQGSGPLPVVFTDTTTNNTFTTMTYNWSVSPSTGWYVTSGDINSQNLGATFVTNGNYTISHGAASPTFGSDIENKTDYIWVYNSTSLLSTGFQTIDLQSGIPIGGSTINMQDIENSTWTNTTTGITGDAHIHTLTGHTINAYASALGYDDNELLAQPAGPLYPYPIYMVPTGFNNATAGNVTLYVTVTDTNTHLPISGADVGISYVSGGIGATILSATTTSAGTASFKVPNQTVIIVQARADSKGYLPGSQSINSGTGSGGADSVAMEISLAKATVTPTITQTTLPGGGTPTPTVTYLANCNPDATDYDEAKCRASHGNSSLNLIAANLDNLVMICLLVTMLYLFGVRLGGR
jgi:PKD repeat protein